MRPGTRPFLDDPCLDVRTGHGAAVLESQVQCRLSGRLRDFRLVVGDAGVVLQGRSQTYHAKQLAQQAVMEATELPIVANEIEVH